MCHPVPGKEPVEARIPDEVRAFVAQHIDSVEQLEVLLALRENAHRAFSPEEIAGELRIDPRSAAQRLKDLQAAGLVVAEGDACRYAPRTAELARRTDALAEMYRTHRVAIISLIFSRPTERIRSFADAFRIRRGEEDG